MADILVIDAPADVPADVLMAIPCAFVAAVMAEALPQPAVIGADAMRQRDSWIRRSTRAAQRSRIARASGPSSASASPSP